MLQICGGSVSSASYRDMDGAGELVGITLHLELFALRKKRKLVLKEKEYMDRSAPSFHHGEVKNKHAPA